METVRKKLKKIFKHMSNQKGFTLLELLVVVAILAGIAGTATIALKDTDARASAAAHVAMMDELNKGIRTYRVLTRNSLPNNFDSLMQLGATDTTDAVRAGSTTSDELLGWAAGDAASIALNADAIGILNDIGITNLQYLDLSIATGLSYTDFSEMIRDRGNAVVANNIFMSEDANGAGTRQLLVDGSVVSIWNGGQERLTGQPDATAAWDAVGNSVFMMVGIGPSATLFDASALGGMTTVPVYRHVAPDQYGRFIGIFKIGTWTAAGTAYDAIDQLEFIGVVDGALDTKEEELGEWDGTRNTI